MTGPLCIQPSIIKPLKIWNEIELDKYKYIYMKNKIQIKAKIFMLHYQEKFQKKKKMMAFPANKFSIHHSGIS